MIPAIWFPEHITSACATMLQELIDVNKLPQQDGFSHLQEYALVAFHGQLWNMPYFPARLNNLIAPLKGVILVSLGDEGCTFPYSEIKHPNLKWWIQTPKPGVAPEGRYLIEGYPPDCRENLANMHNSSRALDWFFAGQNTHARRHQCIDVLRKLPNGNLLETASFWSGYSRHTYYFGLSEAKVAPCPAGPLTPDSFRFAEALEAGCVPVLDAFSPDGVSGYWDMVLGPNHPVQVLADWENFPKVLDLILSNWEQEQKLTQYWWKKFKLTQRSNWLAHDLISLGAKSDRPGILVG